MAGKGKARFTPKKPKVSKNMKAEIVAAVKDVNKKEIETKTINCVDAASTTTNTVGRVYPSASGLQILVADVFSVPQGVADSTAIGALNRIGDKIRGVGFYMDYYIHGYNTYGVGGNQYQIPYIKVRITIWKQAFGIPVLTAPLLYDTNFLTGATSTIQPLNWDKGYIKDLIYDKVHIIQSNYAQVDASTLAAYPLTNVYHFKKYFKYDHPIKFTDNNSATPNSTNMPIYISMSAEVDEGNVFVPSGARLLNTTGYTRAWFKDA